MSAQPPIDYIQRTRDQYASLGYAPYQWVHAGEPPPFTQLTKPVADSKLSLIASGGIYLEGQVAFHFKDDFSYREIDVDAPASKRRATHFAYDLDDAHQDINVVFPVDTLKRMVSKGKLGALAQQAYTFMGGIYSTRKVETILAPAIADRVVADEVDLALLVPA